MNKQERIGKTKSEVMIMRKNSRQTPFTLRKYYGVMIIGFALFLGIMAYYSVKFKEKRELAKQEVELEKSVDAANSATQETTEATESTEDTTAASTEEAAQTMEQTVTYDGKTKLSWPVTGNVVLPYSTEATVYFETLDQYRTNPGILIEAKENDSVKAVKQAKVTEIKNTAEYGKMVCMDLGSGYTAVYGQMKDLTVKAGDTVEKGQVIGKVAASTSYYTLEGTNLYFQMEKDKKSVDPGKYLE